MVSDRPVEVCASGIRLIIAPKPRLLNRVPILGPKATAFGFLSPRPILRERARERVVREDQCPFKPTWGRAQPSPQSSPGVPGEGAKPNAIVRSSERMNQWCRGGPGSEKGFRRRRRSPYLPAKNT